MSVKQVKFRLYHYILLITGISLLTLGYSSSGNPLPLDGFQVRFTLGAVAITILVLNFFSRWVEQNIKWLTYLVIASVSLWGSYLIYLSQIEPIYLFRAMLGAVGFSFVFKNYQWFFSYIVLLFFAVVSALLFVKEPVIHPVSAFYVWFVLLAIISLIFVNILKYRKREWELKHVYSSVIDNITDAYYLVDTEYNLVRLNAKAEEFISEKMGVNYRLGEYLPTLISFEDKSFMEEKLHLVKKGEPQNFVRAYKNNGNTFYRDIWVYPVYNDQREIAYISITTQDITEKVVAEKRLSSERELLEAVNSNINEAIYRSSLSFGMQYANKAFFEIFGYDQSDLKNLSPEELYARKEDRNELVNTITTSGSIKDFEVLLRRKDGTTFWGSINATSTLQDDGNMIIDGGIRDISKEKAFKDQLIRTEKVLEVINEANIELISTENVRETMKRMFSAIGETLNINRIYLFENYYQESKLAAKQTLEWTNDQQLSEADMEELQGLPYEKVGLSRWATELAKGKLIYGTVDSLPEEERVILKAQKIKSILVAPVLAGDDFVGFIGFDDCEQKRQWSTTLQTILKNLSAAFGAAIQRERNATELIKAKEKAEELDKIKSKFVSKASHELKTPINGIIGLTEVMLSEKEKFDEEGVNYINLIKSNSEKLLNSISNILEFTRQDSTETKDGAEKLNVADFLEKEHHLLKVVAEQKGLNFHLELPSDVGSILINPIAFSHIINNFVGNAIKFTDNGDVWIKAEDVGEKVKIIIKDTGVGIDEEHHQRIFDAFERISDSDGSYKQEGSGLGLFIANKYLKAFDGEMTMESTPGKGTTFTLLFPKAAKTS